MRIVWVCLILALCGCGDNLSEFVADAEQKQALNAPFSESFAGENELLLEDLRHMLGRVLVGIDKLLNNPWIPEGKKLQLEEVEARLVTYLEELESNPEVQEEALIKIRESVLTFEENLVQHCNEAEDRIVKDDFKLDSVRQAMTNWFFDTCIIRDEEPPPHNP